MLLGASLLTLALLLLAAAAFDWRQRRIPNGLVLLGLAHAGLVQTLAPSGLHPASWSHPGLPGVASGLWAAALMLAVCMPLWKFGALGAGDAKWLTVTAAHAAPALVPLILLATALAGGALALAWIAAARSDRMPYAVAIAAGQFALMALMATPGLAPMVLF